MANTSNERVDEMLQRLRDAWERTGLAPFERDHEHDLRRALKVSMDAMAEGQIRTPDLIAVALRLESVPADPYITALLRELPAFGLAMLDIVAQARMAYMMIRDLDVEEREEQSLALGDPT